MSSMYPQVVGHEIVGEVLRVGDKVEKSIKVGDIVGVGAQCDSCQDCEYCDKGQYLSSACDRLLTLQVANNTVTLVIVVPTPANSSERPPPRARSHMEDTQTTGEVLPDSSSPFPTTSTPPRLHPCFVEEPPSTLL